MINTIFIQEMSWCHWDKNIFRGMSLVFQLDSICLGPTNYMKFIYDINIILHRLIHK